MFRIGPVVALLAMFACDSAKTPAAETEAFSEVVAAIAARSEKVRSYRYDGEVKIGEATLPFRYALSQPQRLLLELPSQKARFIFDGQVLAIFDDGKKVVKRQDLTKVEPQLLIETLHQVFGDYAVEGWKPPMLRTESNDTTATRGKKGWRVVVNLDDPDVESVEYELQAPKANFVRKQTVGKGGKVLASVVVDEHHYDDKTALSFPKVWTRTEPAGSYRLTLKRIEVNVPIANDQFSTRAPDGYAAQDFEGIGK